MAPSDSSSGSIWTRKRDLAYVVYFALHIPILLLIDLAVFYPAKWTPWVSFRLREISAVGYKDQFFVDPPGWFVFYTYMEILHLPFSIYALYSLLYPYTSPSTTTTSPPPTTPKLHLSLLLYGFQTLLTTLTCIVDMLNWDDVVVNWNEKMALLTLYGPYAAISGFMVVDCWGRVLGALEEGGEGEGEGKKRV